jgi:two-component sensor histidine kinase
VIGMALHELATNALKYGSLSSRSGQVTISWETTPEGEFRMSWVERNGPVVGSPTRIGFGRRVVERMVAISTNGSVDLKFEPSGVEWRLNAHFVSVSQA